MNILLFIGCGFPLLLTLVLLIDHLRTARKVTGQDKKPTIKIQSTYGESPAHFNEWAKHIHKSLNQSYATKKSNS